jgi:ribosome-binding factor A
MAWDKFEKLVELLKRRVAQVVLYRLKDPRIGFVTITKIDLARDMKLMKVFYTVYGPKPDMTKTTCALEDAKGFIQREVAKTLRTRTMPSIQFVLDPSLDKAERVEQILQSLREEEPGDGGEDGEDDLEGSPDKDLSP